MKRSVDKTGRDSPITTEAFPTTGATSGINPSGHKQELERNFTLFSTISLAATSGNTWIAFGGTLSVAIYNGGAPGVIYEFIAVSVLYWFIAASIAELASAMPSAGGVYHWASVTGGRFGRPCGFFAGWWNFLAWIFGLASIAQIMSAQLTSMYAVSHPGFVTQSWHIFVTYLLITWIMCAILLFANRLLPMLEQAGFYFIIAGVLISIIVCAVMPGVTGSGYASNSSVWLDWENGTGYSSNGFVFLAGMLNGAFAVGTPDITSHLAEELPRPSHNIPKAVLAQYVLGFFTALFYCIAILYAVNDFEAVSGNTYRFPLAEIYHQATGSSRGAVGLLIVAFIPTFIGTAGVYLTASRMFWTLARDSATPGSRFFGRVHPRLLVPANAIVLCGVIATILGFIYLGSETAFLAFVGSFAVLGFASYLSAILPYLLGGRSCVVPGPFHMGKLGFLVNGVACGFIITFTVIFCFPYALPVDASTMNYTSLITGGCSIFVAVWWFIRQGSYEGPHYVPLGAAALTKDAV